MHYIRLFWLIYVSFDLSVSTRKTSIIISCTQVSFDMHYIRLFWLELYQRLVDKAVRYEDFHSCSMYMRLILCLHICFDMHTSLCVLETLREGAALCRFPFAFTCLFWHVCASFSCIQISFDMYRRLFWMDVHLRLVEKAVRCVDFHSRGIYFNLSAKCTEQKRRKST